MSCKNDMDLSEVEGCPVCNNPVMVNVSQKNDDKQITCDFICKDCNFKLSVTGTIDSCLRRWNEFPRYNHHKCYFSIHDFSRWSDVETYNITVSREDKNFIKGSRLIQTRKCKRCGLKEFREVVMSKV